MRFLDAIYQQATQRAVKAEQPGRLRADPGGPLLSFTDTSRQDSQADLYTKLSWIQIAVQNAATTAAAIPFRVKQDGKEILEHPFVKNEDSAIFGNLRRPNPLMSRFEFLTATFAWYKAIGNCYWWLNRAGPEYPPAEIWIIPAHRMTPVPDGQMGLAGYLYDPGDGRRELLQPWEVVHFKTWNPTDRYVGLSPLQALMYDANGDIGAQRFNANFYANDNAKSSGILAFSDYVPDASWNKIASDWEEQHGGTQHKRIMRLRGVGAGGVQWIPTQLTRVETQYLEQRTFTKEQIYEIFAPGLSSVLAVNSTEANSIAGKDTFLEMCIFPMHVAIGEKIDSDILPAYGPNLDGEFDDVRRVDTAVELQEQQAYERTHTIDEVREKYYGDAPMPDERGAWLASDRQSPPAAQSEPQPIPPQLIDPNLALAQAGKALDRKRWATKAIKALAAGRSADVPFEPEYLDDDEAMPIRAALKRACTAADVKDALA